jgi:hypothetical protein
MVLITSITGVIYMACLWLQKTKPTEIVKPFGLFEKYFLLLLGTIFIGTAAQAQWTPWANAPLADVARLNVSASKIAFLNPAKGQLTVHAVGTNAMLGARLWAAGATDQVVGFCWWGNGLLVSRVRAGKEETVRIVPDGKTPEKIVLPVAGRYIAASPTGDLIAVTPRKAQKAAATIEFYRRDADLWKKVAAYTGPSSSGFERSSLSFERGDIYVIDFAADGSGLFAVVPDPMSRSNDRILVFITPDGKSYALTSGNAPFIPEKRDGLPLIAPLKRGEWPAVALGGLAVATFGLMDSPTPSASQLLPGDWRQWSLVAWLPDGGKLYQKADAAQQNSELVVVNEAERKRAIPPSAPYLMAASGWIGNRLVARTSDVVDYDAPPVKEGTRLISPRHGGQWGVLLTAPQVWAKVEVPEKNPPHAEVVENFLKRDDIIRPENADVSIDSSVEKGVFSFRLAGSMRFDGVKLDETTLRVVEYRGPSPAPPLPEKTISIETAKTRAEAFARSLNPTFFSGEAAQVSVGEINDLAAFPVRFSRSKTEWIEVGVHAGEGKVVGYCESAFLPDYEKQRLARGEKERDSYIPPAFSDLQLSPDGSQVAFCWTAPTPGYPAWWRSRPSALWVVSTSGGAPRLIATEVSARASWSPDSKRLAFTRRGQIGLVDLVTKATRYLPPPPARRLEPSLIGWKNARELLIGWTHNGPGSTDLLSWDGAGTPRVLARDWTNLMGNEDGVRGTVLSPDGKTLAVIFEGGFREGSGLFLFPTANLTGKPRKMDSKIEFPHWPVWTSAGIFSFSRDGTSLTDPDTGKSVRWDEPEPLKTIRDSSVEVGGNTAQNISVSAEAKKLAFFAYTNRQARSGWTLFVSDFTGLNVHSLLPP